MKTTYGYFSRNHALHMPEDGHDGDAGMVAESLPNGGMNPPAICRGDSDRPRRGACFRLRSDEPADPDERRAVLAGMDGTLADAAAALADAPKADVITAHGVVTGYPRDTAVWECARMVADITRADNLPRT